MASRLPIPGKDHGTWGAILNNFLMQAHNADGTLKQLDQSQIKDLVTDMASKVATADLAPVATSGSYDDLTNKPANLDSTNFALREELSGRVQIPLGIPTYDGNANVTHPDALYIPEGFGPNRHRYWMVYTPYPDDLRENPTVASSPDGVEWSIPAGAPNPVVPYSEMTAGGYYFNSDPALLRLQDGKLAIYYRPVQSASGQEKIALMRKTTEDGVTWSAAQTILSGSYTPGNVPYRSPAFVREPNGHLTMFSIATVSNVEQVERWTSTDDGQTFTRIGTVSVPGNAIRHWHLDVKKVGDRYWMLLNRRVTWDLQLLVSDNGNTFTHVQIIPKSGTSWDGFGHYRSSLVPVPGHPATFDIYASGISNTGTPPTPDGGGGNAPMDAQWRLILFKGFTANDPGQVTGGVAGDETNLAAHPTAKATGTTEGVALGMGATVSGVTFPGSVAVGPTTNATNGSIAIGRGTSATGNKSLAIGYGVSTSQANAMIVGAGATASAANTTALGVSASAGSSYATSTGYLAVASGGNSLALGARTTASALGAVAVGEGSSATHSGAIALGRSTATTAANQIAGGPRHIELTEVTADPTAPAANSGRLYFRKNGGKSQLCVLFPTGAVQVIATEP